MINSHGRRCIRFLEIFKESQELSKGIHPNSSTYDIYYYPEPICKLLKKVKKKYDRVVVDCQLFIQIATVLKNSPNEPFFLLDGNLNRNIREKYYGKTDEFAYLSPEGDELFMALNQMIPWLNNRGHWLIKDGDNRQWVGFTNEGIVKKSLNGWRELAKELVRRECTLMIANQDAETITRENAQAILKAVEAGEFDAWKLR